ncbi:MAG: 16S rRNA (cytosine(967)-C(5))-methyltransferase RsmB [Methylococcaceae bacterium]|nr:16S rRNA (cytosine(967)-C(5))-methyltransferase RsmB [Methylococcaceae bacterium]
MSSRAAAAAILVRVLADGRSLTAALEETLPTVPKEADRAFVQNLVFGVLRWYGRLDAVLRVLAPKPIRDEPVRMLALLGLYQLEYTRVKPHAAVAETVGAAGRKDWARGLLNGVLRNYQRRREELLATADSDDAARNAHPMWLLKRLRADWPEDYQALLEEANRQAPMTLRVNRRCCRRDDYLVRLAQAGIESRAADVSPDGVVLTQPLAVEQLPGFGEGWVSVQDAAAQLAAPLLEVGTGQRVLDLCAAPGGKTVHVLEIAEPTELVAVDIEPARLVRVEANLARAGMRATVQAGDAARPDWWDGRGFDRILVDAPCSATGVIRRHPDIKWLRQPGDVAPLATQQAAILDAAWPLLKRGGKLLYATCSVLREENDAQVAAFLQRHADAAEDPIQAEWGRTMSHGRQILTGTAGMDGFYYARLVKGPG